MKTASLQYVLFSLTVVIFNTSCEHYYYQPSANNVPLFKEKNEARIQLQSSGGNYLSGFDAQTAYAVGKHTGLQLNFFHTGDQGGSSSGQGNYIEAAVGYFTPLPADHWIFETYAGIGHATVVNTYGPSESSKFGMSKFFIQPDFGFRSKYFSIGVSSKFSLANYSLLSSSVQKSDFPYDVAEIEFLKNKSFLLWEPGIMLRGGFEHVQLLVQATYCIPSSPDLKLDNVNISLGIVAPFKIKAK